MSNFVKGSIAVLILASFVLFFLLYKNSSIISDKSQSSDPQTKILKEEKEKLVEGFPEFPIYPGSVITRSYYGTNGGKDVYASELEVLEKTQEEVMEWYEDEKLPETWIYDEPLTDLSNGGKRLKVHQKGSPLRVTLSVTQEKSDSPVFISIFAIKDNENNE